MAPRLAVLLILFLYVVEAPTAQADDTCPGE